MEILQLILHNFVSFVLIISVIVFIHEFGHFYIARLNGVKVEQFSIGFGKELWGFDDKKGTRWKICLLPFGGYVKMYGDRNAASMPDQDLAKEMSKEEKKISFIGKSVYQRMAIVAAGPIANFILTIFIFTILFRVNGINTVPPVISEVVKDSAAYESGFKNGDKIIEINDKEITDFSQIKNIVITNLEDEMSVVVLRNGKVLKIKITPKIQIRKDVFGDDAKVPTIGIIATQVKHQKLNLYQGFIEANKETYRVTTAIFKTIGQLITGKRDVKELGGPVKIAKYSGKTVDMGLTAVLWFAAMISLNLGVMNLLPIPVLDGGHLFYYVIEAIKGKPLSQKAQQFGFQVGFSLILALMAFTTINDITQLIAK